MTEMATLNPQQLLDWGIIQEINRRLLHPRGLALYVDTELVDGRVKMGVWPDPSNDPEGWIFEFASMSEETLVRHRAKVDAFDALLKPQREAVVGYVIEPIP